MFIKNTDSFFEVKPLIAPFGFKGKYVSGLWYVTVKLSDGENTVYGNAIQSPLWSDAEVFGSTSFDGSNTFMYAITCKALKMIEGKYFSDPIKMQDEIFPELLKYAQTVTASEDVRKTYVLNALVALDYAAWQLYGAEKGLVTFDDMIPDEAKKALSHKAEKMLRIPLVTYGYDEKGIRELIADNNYFLKIKIGNDPDKDGDPLKMLAWDKARLTEIHDIAKHTESPYSEKDDIKYYLDANGRYPDKSYLADFIAHAEKIGAKDSIIFIEEPFDEKNEVYVGDLGVRIAADESAHSAEDAKKRIEMGYTAIALKPIAKTQSESFRIAAVAHEKNIPLFCADLTVTPSMVRLNKMFASRLPLLPGMKAGVLESNGHQNYPDWDKMEKELPSSEEKYSRLTKGAYTLDEDFYKLPFNVNK